MAGTFFYAIASALVPVLNLEIYLGAVAAEVPHMPLWALGLLAGGGQMVGKCIWYYAGTHTTRIPWIRRKMEKEKWQKSYAKWSGYAGRHGHTGFICFAAAVVGIPPFAVISVMAGSLRMNFAVFTVTGLVGRSIRFWAVLAGVGLIFNH